MARQMYENDQTLAAERLIVKQVAEQSDLGYNKMPISYQVDFALTSGNRVVSLLEVKERNMRYGQYPDVILSVHKYEKGMAYSTLLDIPFLFAVKMKDGIYITQLRGKTEDKAMYEVSYSGRTRNTRDSADIEMVVHVPMNEFTKV